MGGDSGLCGVVWGSVGGAILFGEIAMKLVLDDGGRAAACLVGKVGDCVCRSIAIATEMPYMDVYELINKWGSEERLSKYRRIKSSASMGVYRATTKKLMASLGWTWHPTMGIGTGCRVHLRDGEIPMKGRLVVQLSRHLTAVIDGVIHDTFNPARGGTRCVYGYWTKD